MTGFARLLPGARARNRTVRALAVLALCIAGGAVVVVTLDRTGTDYAFLAAYTILQFVALATAWNILGGYAGYVNFGVAGFFAVGVYTALLSTRRCSGR
jgi:branched-chain amino acid transport system permease protein